MGVTPTFVGFGESKGADPYDDLPNRYQTDAFCTSTRSHPYPTLTTANIMSVPK